LTAFFFGDSQAHLLGCLHEPAPALDRSHGVVLCPPIGQEHIRTHWAMRQVALALAKVGFHCLRFDWFGVGDSAGSLAEASLQRWQENAVLAAQELRDVARVRRISLVGLRLGATIAAMAAKRIAPVTLVLWDPILDGAQYVADLRSLHETLASDSARYWNPRPRHAAGSELVGFDFGARLLAEIGCVDSAMVADLPQTKVHLLCSSPASEIERFERRLREANHDVRLTHSELRARWTSNEAVEELLLAGDAVRTLTSLLTERAAGSEARTV